MMATVQTESMLLIFLNQATQADIIWLAFQVSKRGSRYPCIGQSCEPSASMVDALRYSNTSHFIKENRYGDVCLDML